MASIDRWEKKISELSLWRMDVRPSEPDNTQESSGIEEITEGLDVPEDTDSFAVMAELPLDADINLVDPDGIKQDPTDSSATGRLWMIQSPKPGRWVVVARLRRAGGSLGILAARVGKGIKNAIQKWLPKDRCEVCLFAAEWVPKAILIHYGIPATAAEAAGKLGHFLEYVLEGKAVPAWLTWVEQALANATTVGSKGILQIIIEQARGGLIAQLNKVSRFPFRATASL